MPRSVQPLLILSVTLDAHAGVPSMHMLLPSSTTVVVADARHEQALSIGSTFSLFTRPRSKAGALACAGPMASR
jgi:hypothetical protein